MCRPAPWTIRFQRAQMCLRKRSHEFEGSRLLRGKLRRGRDVKGCQKLLLPQANLLCSCHLQDGQEERCLALGRGLSREEFRGREELSCLKLAHFLAKPAHHAFHGHGLALEVQEPVRLC